MIEWIRMCPSTLKTFVANRVSEIQALGLRKLWHHVSSLENPADMLSRGATVEELKSSDLWWHRPKWLQENGPWPEQPNSVIELPEKKTVINLVVIMSHILIYYLMYLHLHDSVELYLIIESLHRSLILFPRVSRTVLQSFANNSAAHNSNLGIVKTFNGAILVIAQIE